MLTTYRRRRQLARVEPGDGSALPELRVWHLFTRTRFGLDLEGHRFDVDVRYGADPNTGHGVARLYRDRVQVARSRLPATFVVPGGVVELAEDEHGLKRVAHVAHDGTERTLDPHPSTLEGRRARFGRRFPVASRGLGVLAVLLVVVCGAIELAHAAQSVTRNPEIAARIGTITLPHTLSAGWLTAIGIVGALTATERALTLRGRLVGRRG
ncbi:hypothetical protein [Actinomycetospora soli]|uniref:hypothetical protein n=1 Tax=Actinomycetospora soli TaxID=2893887 RepID=UPI001E55FD6A|nr:hypothetical protein [Actinomycetospora soli]MCD2185925.1 hypothetical protein [Actinomycetospora soli]